jgi:hypothetical protein
LTMVVRGVGWFEVLVRKVRVLDVRMYWAMGGACSLS